MWSYSGIFIIISIAKISLKKSVVQNVIEQLLCAADRWE